MTDTPMRVGLIGLGAVGQSVIQLLNEHAAKGIEVVGALVRDPSRDRNCAVSNIVSTVDELLATAPEVVVEAGGHRALSKHGPAILRTGSDLIIISIGALADPAVEREIALAANAGRSQARVVSGAIGGLDALGAAAIGGLSRVTHTTRKPARTLLTNFEGLEVGTAQEVFHGTAREGALKFPESVNVAAAVSLAGMGFDRTEVRILADPAIERNLHEVFAEGAFGTLRFQIRNVPSEANPRTAKLVAMSAVRALMQRRSRLIIG